MREHVHHSVTAQSVYFSTGQTSSHSRLSRYIHFVDSDGPQPPARTLPFLAGRSFPSPLRMGSMMPQASSTSSLRANRLASPESTSKQQSLVSLGHAPWELGVKAELEVRRAHLHAGVGHFRLELQLHPFGRLDVNHQAIACAAAMPVDSGTACAAARGTESRSASCGSSWPCRCADRTARPASASCRYADARRRTWGSGYRAKLLLPGDTHRIGRESWPRPRLRRAAANRLQDFNFFVAHQVGVEARRHFHRRDGQQLQQDDSGTCRAARRPIRNSRRGDRRALLRRP